MTSEPLDIRAIRHVFRGWPLPRGKGLLLKAFSPWLRNRDFVFEVADGVLISADMQDWITVHGLVEGYDADFRESWSLIRPGATVLDVGANIGIWAIGAAQIAGAVHCFEPMAGNFKRLQANLALNRVSNVVPQNVALSDRPAVLQFYPSPNSNSGVGVIAQKEWNVQTCDIQALALDDYCGEYRIAPDFLKIDVEGAELLVLKGAERVLRESKPQVFFEMDRVMSGKFGTSPEAITAFLEDRGYSVMPVHGADFLATFTGK